MKDTKDRKDVRLKIDGLEFGRIDGVYGISIMPWGDSIVIELEVAAGDETHIKNTVMSDALMKHVQELQIGRATISLRIKTAQP